MKSTLLSALVLFCAARSSLAEARDGQRDLFSPAGGKVARALSARELAPSLASAQRTVVRAAITAAPAAQDGWHLLAPLAEIATHADRSLAAPAARSAAAIAGALDRERVMIDEIPVAWLRRLVWRWGQIASRRDRWADVRIHALEVVAGLSSVLEPTTGAPFEVGSLLSDIDPEVRRAAVELLPQTLTATRQSELAGLASDDPDEQVALAAAQVLCASVPAGVAPPASFLPAKAVARLREAHAQRGLSIPDCISEPTVNRSAGKRRPRKR
jgi:hypothetical protein